MNHWKKNIWYQWRRLLTKLLKQIILLPVKVLVVWLKIVELPGVKLSPVKYHGLFSCIAGRHSLIEKIAFKNQPGLVRVNNIGLKRSLSCSW